ncbi:MAG: hypothetical protein V4613_09870 [Bacteroidota bacterium]
MNVNSIKLLVEHATIEELKKAEADLMEGDALAIAVEGKDEGEQLTHILAAIYCKETMASENIPLMQAIRLYSQRVRGSIN